MLFEKMKALEELLKLFLKYQKELEAVKEYSKFTAQAQITEKLLSDIISDIEKIIEMKKVFKFKELKDGIKYGRIKKLYFSSKNLWWTHSEEDVEEVSRIGHIVETLRAKKMLADKDRSVGDELEARKILSLKYRDKKLGSTGEELVEINCPKRWLKEAERYSSQFGENGLEALMSAHHRNSLVIIDDWGEANVYFEYFVKKKYLSLVN